MDIELIAIASGVVFGGGLIVAKYVVGHLIAAKAAKEKDSGE
ncbi:MAG TPA: hypothetical protein VLL76_04090 [Candidatus Omnitrophota bacterium]|nr:hypothetical protein [Candidatus Omnitrophota bacterium]